MAVHFHVCTTDSRPENLQVTQELERRYKEQEAAKQTSKTKTSGTFKVAAAESGGQKMNINDCVIVRLTEHGERQWNSHWKRSSPSGVPDAIRSAQTLPDGRVRFHLHELMNVFGAFCFNGSSQLPFADNEITLPEELTEKLVAARRFCTYCGLPVASRDVPDSGQTSTVWFHVGPPTSSYCPDGKHYVKPHPTR